MQLTPARRLFYGIGIVGFLLGLIYSDLFYNVGSFVILNFLLALELVDKLTTRDELEIAREIQLSLQPDGRTEALSQPGRSPAALLGWRYGGHQLTKRHV
jgi:hypothetical protein